MSTGQTAAPSGRGEFATGWGILLAATIGTAVTGVHFPVTGAMMNPLHEAYGWTRGQIGLSLTMAAIISAIVHLPTGILVDRFGPRRILIPGTIAFGLCIALFGLAGPALWTWYGAYAIFSAAVIPASAFVWFNAVVRHFQKQRGLALAIALTGSGILTAIMPALILDLVGNYGVRGAYFVMAACAGALTFASALIFIPRHFGGAGETGDHAPTPAADKAERHAILRTSRFWRLAAAVALISLGVGVYSVHFQPMLTDAGLTPEQAAHTAYFMGPSFILGVLGTGLLFDRLDARLVSVVTFLLPAVASALLLAYDGGPVMSAIIGLIIGATLGAPVNVIGYTASYFFEVRHYGFVSGIFFATLSIAIGVGSWLAGLLFDTTGSYQSTYVLMLVGGVLAALLVLSLGKGQAAPATAAA